MSQIPLKPIPQPPTVPFLGNVSSIDTALPIRSFDLLAKQYGEIYQLTIGGATVVHVNSYKLLRELSDDKRFVKVVRGSLMEVRNLAGDGLFTAQTDEQNWGKAHRILMPAFGPAAIRTMFDDMRDICSQLLAKWDRFGPDNVFDPSDDFTRLTFDTIALCSMSHRLNSFYTPTSPAFTQAMVAVLAASNRRALTPQILKPLRPVQNALPEAMGGGKEERYRRDVKMMKSFGEEILKKRKDNPPAPGSKKDLLTLMLEGVDPVTKEKMDEENIIFNLLTFLIAGHETTSGMLSFTLYFLLKHPETLQKLREEVDNVTDGGRRALGLQDLGGLEYLVAVMRESLRLAPTAPQRAVAPKEDTIIEGKNGRYEVKKGTTIVLHVTHTMRDVDVWGEDAETFRPERMLGGGFEGMPPQAWQPFGFGMRGCIGRAFAWQEILLVLGAIVQTFDLTMAEPGYTLQLRQALTIKPKGFSVRARRRVGRSVAIYAVPAGVLGETEKKVDGGVAAANTAEKLDGEEQRLYVLYGSNTGTCEGFAQRVVEDAGDHGFKATLDTLDSFASRLPSSAPIIIITASFEGEPANNASLFVSYLSSLVPEKQSLKGVQYLVFGCGNREWVNTYQRIPTLIDELMKSNGAERIMQRGEADAATAGFFGAWEEFEGKMWGVLQGRYGQKGGSAISATTATPASTPTTSSFHKESLNVQFVAPVEIHERAELLRQKDLGAGKVTQNRLLSKVVEVDVNGFSGQAISTGAGTGGGKGGDVGEKRHLEITLPEGMEYSAGDYLAVLPLNPAYSVERAIRRFGLKPEQTIIINSAVPTTFPIDKPLSVQHLLNGYVELSQPATLRDLQFLTSIAKDAATQAKLKELTDNYEAKIMEKRISVLDIIEDFPSIDVPFAGFLKMLPPMRIRQYSISSSPLVNPERVTLTISVVNAPSLSKSEKQFFGVGSNYLASLRPSDEIQVAVRPSNAVFHLPIDPMVPVVMFAAGSGIAPFRGFIEERATQKKSGRETGKMLLFFGCRSEEGDYLYADQEMGEWMRDGVVDVRPAFSRMNERSKGCKYVQDRIWHDRADITAFYNEGAKFYTCGSRKAANGIKKVCVDIIKSNNPKLDDAGALVAFEKVQKERYATDIFD